MEKSWTVARDSKTHNGLGEGLRLTGEDCCGTAVAALQMIG